MEIIGQEAQKYRNVPYLHTLRATLKQLLLAEQCIHCRIM